MERRGPLDSGFKEDAPKRNLVVLTIYIDLILIGLTLLQYLL